MKAISALQKRVYMLQLRHEATHGKEDCAVCTHLLRAWSELRAADGAAKGVAEKTLADLLSGFYE